nr:hypothetical protein [Tanacetum cinerariifolium]
MRLIKDCQLGIMGLVGITWEGEGAHGLSEGSDYVRMRVQGKEVRERGIMTGFRREISEVQGVCLPPVTKIPTVGIPTGSGMVPTVSPIFTTASVVVTPLFVKKTLCHNLGVISKHS